MVNLMVPGVRAASSASRRAARLMLLAAFAPGCILPGAELSEGSSEGSGGASTSTNTTASGSSSSGGGKGPAATASSAGAGGQGGSSTSVTGAGGEGGSGGGGAGGSGAGGSGAGGSGAGGSGAGGSGAGGSGAGGSGAGGSPASGGTGGSETGGTAAATPGGDAPNTVPLEEPEEERDLMLDLYSTQVRRFIRTYYATRAQGCFDHASRNNEGIRGTVVVTFTIAADGTIPNARATRNTTGDVALGGCLVSQVRAWDLPDPPGGELELAMPFSR